ncbi:MAG: M20/M25/M40 family metallo-hydrolase, partial [Sphingopyxis sp.]
EIEQVMLDNGTDWFQPSNIEITDLAVGNPAHNVIPAGAEARISIRFNDLHSGSSLIELISGIAGAMGGSVEAKISGEAFLTPPGELSSMIAEAIRAETGLETELSTTGGTSDARFLSRICPVVEFGLCNATMHKLDEAVAIADLDTLARIYRRVVLGALVGTS